MLAFTHIYGTCAAMQSKNNNIIVFDLETQLSFDDVGGRDNFRALKVSVLGAYSYATNEYLMFEERELGKFEELLAAKPLLVGFNSRKFDCEVLQPYMRINLAKLPQLDILEEIVKAVGHRVKLESVAQATLGSGKSGSGLDALRYWRDGEIEKLKKYCLDDVKVTRQVYEYGAAHGELLFTSKYGTANSRAVVNWKIEHADVEEDSHKQMSMF
jgi:DEAD/DEAH box helicase domain-containing protein